MSCSEWQKVKLGDVVIFNPKESLKKGAISKKIAMDCLAPYCRKISSFEFAEFSGGTKFRNGDTIMARITPCLENGKTALVSVLDENEVGFGSTEYIVFREKLGVTNYKFIYYFVTNPSFRDIAIQSMVGSSGRQRVQQDVLENLEIDLPPLAEQERIAGILGALDDKIELNNRINRNLEEQAQALFRRWFVDEAETGWETKKLSDFFPVITGKKDANFSTPEGEYPFFTCSQTSINAPTYSFNGAAVLLAGNGDFNVKRYIGKFEAYQRTYVLMPYDPKYVNFLYLVINHYLHDITGGSRGSVIKFITKGNIADYKIRLPLYTIDDKLIVFNRLFQIIDNGQRENYTLVRLRDTLLPKLMNNELSLDNLQQ